MDFNLTKEQQDIVKAARKFAKGEFQDRAVEFDREEKFDLKIWKKACDLGFVGVFIDEDYGGAGYGFLEHCLINEEFWAVDPGMASAILSTSFGAELLILFGTEDQRQLVLPKIVEGRAIVGTAITEPDAGCDVTGADYIMLFCQTDPENPSRHQRFSFILLPTDTAGYKATKIKGKLGVRASDTAELALNDVRIPLDNLIGTEGQGFYHLMEFFNRTRLHICAQAVGLARAALEESIRYTKSRCQFGKPIADFQATQFKLAEMATGIRAARNLYYEAAWLADQNKLDHALTAMAKWYSGKMAVECADEALQMHGGYGYIDEYKVQRLYRDAKILEIYEGTKEIEKTIVAGALLK